ncbi:MAG: 3D domain-containing protein [Planctomycetota bacterium]|nr:3D domain-containing protein [Planctomycetota bacterium]
MQNRRHNRLFTSPLELLGFSALTLVVAASAAMMKQANTAPALVAFDQVRAVAEPVDTVAASNTTPVVAPAAQAKLVDVKPNELPAAEPQGTIRYFNGRKVRAARTVWMTVTAYSPDHRSCGKWADGITASNKSVWTNGMKLVAADTRLLPFGTLLSVPGYDDGKVVPVLDRGGAIKGARLDVLYPTHQIARRWGVQRLPITIWEYVDEDQG